MHYISAAPRTYQNPETHVAICAKRYRIKIKDDINTLYEKLNRKLDILTKQTGNTKTHKGNTQTENNGLINFTNTPFTKEQINTLKMGPQYAIERNPKFYINELIIDTENAIRHLHNSMQNTFRHLAAKMIKQIKASNRHNAMHKRHQ